MCVEVDKTFGVVCLDRATVFCSTCKHGSRSCKHVKYLLDHIHSSEGDIAVALQPFLGVSPPQQSHHVYKPYNLQVLSRKGIPFSTTSKMKILRQSFQERFAIVDGAGHLHSQDMLPCPECGSEREWSADKVRSHLTTIIRSNQVFKAEGKEKWWSTSLGFYAKST